MAEFDEDQDDMRDDLMGDEADNRACAFCGALIHPSSHRCPECGGHVGIAWGTVHKEQFLFLLSACLIGVGCLVSWDQVRPSAFDGTQTIRGSLMLALAVYGVIVGLVGIFNRRTVVWPYFANALFALWVGVGAISNVWGGERWQEYGRQSGTWYRHLRAIPPGFWLLTVGGAFVVIAVLKGLVGGFASAKAKARDTAEEKATKDAGRRSRRMGGTTPPPVTGVDPITGSPLPPAPPPV